MVSSFFFQLFFLKHQHFTSKTTTTSKYCSLNFIFGEDHFKNNITIQFKSFKISINFTNTYIQMDWRLRLHENLKKALAHKTRCAHEICNPEYLSISLFWRNEEMERERWKIECVLVTHWWCCCKIAQLRFFVAVIELLPWKLLLFFFMKK
jgi:hypothetical protein